MKIILLGLMFTEESLKEAKVYSKAGVQVAPHLFQKRMISGLEKIQGVDLKVYSIPPIGSYPLNYKRLIIKERTIENQKEIGGINLPIIKNSTRRSKIYKLLKEALKKGEEVYTLIYTLYEPFLIPIKKLKKKYKNLHTCLIQTDCVPGVGDMEKYMMPKRKKQGERLIRLSKNIDKFIVLTKYLAEALEIDNKSHMVMECICDESQSLIEGKNAGNNVCLYTGTTEKEYGICELVDAFKYLPNGELWICGSGNSDEYIRKVQEQYPNIKHFGFLSQNEVAKLRSQCDFMINPRRPTGTYTKYSFPSKTAEYLMSGKPTIMYKLEGIPDEYDEYLNYLHSENPIGIAEELNKIFASNYIGLTEKAKQGVHFMCAEKTPKRQAERIVEFLKR